MWLILALASAIIYVAQWAVVRASHQKIPSSLMTVAHSVLGPLFAVGVFAYPLPNEPIVWIWLFWIFIVNPPFSWLATYAVQRIPVSLSQPLTSFGIVSSTFVGWLAFNVQFPPLGLLGIALGFAGLWLLYHAQWNEWKKPYPWILAVAMLNFGMISLLSGQVLAVYPHPVIVSGLDLTGAMSIAAIASLSHHKRMRLNRENIAMLIFIAVTHMIGDIILITALGLAPAGYVVSVKRVSIILSALIGYAVFRERQTPFWRLMAATAILTLGIVFMAIR